MRRSLVLPMCVAMLAALTFSAWLSAQEPGQGRKPGDIYTNKLGMKFAWIPPGTFTMGSPLSEKLRANDETQHKVTLTKGFWMGVHPVTQAQWQDVMGNNPSWFRNGGDYPVDDVSWNDCQKFLKKLGTQEGTEYRLPTEAEWEYACRAGTTTAYNTGDGEAALKQAGWYKDNSDLQVHPVGQKTPNKWGLYDMHGTVWQWCADWYGPYPQGDAQDPQGSRNGKNRVMRGGARDMVAHYCRAAYRIHNAPNVHSYNIGFRVVLVAPPRTP